MPDRDLIITASSLGNPPFGELLHAASEAGFAGISLWPAVTWRQARADGWTRAEMRAALDHYELYVHDVDALGNVLEPRVTLLSENFRLARIYGNYSISGRLEILCHTVTRAVLAARESDYGDGTAGLQDLTCGIAGDVRRRTDGAWIEILGRLGHSAPFRAIPVLRRRDTHPRPGAHSQSARGYACHSSPLETAWVIPPERCRNHTRIRQKENSG